MPASPPSPRPTPASPRPRTATVAEATETEEAEETAEAEPVTAETRPAAGTRGSTTVGDGVVAKVVTMVARKADGVHDLGDEVSVVVEDDVATIKVSLVVEFG